MAVLHFVRVVGIGVVVGLVVSLAVSKVIHKVDDPMIEITLTTIAGYGCFVLAEGMHASGVIATVTAGMLCGNYAARTGMSPSTRVAVNSFWEYLAFALNSLVFLLIGFEVRVEALLDSWQPIVVAWAAMTVARGVVIFAVASLLRQSRERIPWRGPPSSPGAGCAAASRWCWCSACRGMPHRELIQTMTFGVVILSILIQGLTMGPLLRRFELVAEDKEWKTYEKRRTESGVMQAALRSLDSIGANRLAHPDIVKAVRAEYETKSREAEEAVGRLHFERGELRAHEMLGVRRQVLLAQKEYLLESLHRGLMGQESFESLSADLDAQLGALRSGEGPE